MLERRGQPLADHPARGAPQLHQRHLDGGHPSGQQGRRRDRADHVHRGGVLQGGSARRPVPVPLDRAVHGALHASVHRLHPGAEHQGLDSVCHCRRAAGPGADGQRDGHRGARVAAEPQAMVRV